MVVGEYSFDLFFLTGGSCYMGDLDDYFVFFIGALIIFGSAVGWLLRSVS